MATYSLIRGFRARLGEHNLKRRAATSMGHAGANGAGLADRLNELIRVLLCVEVEVALRALRQAVKEGAPRQAHDLRHQSDVTRRSVAFPRSASSTSSKSVIRDRMSLI